MFTTNLKNFQTDLGENTVLSKQIDIDENLKALIIIDSIDKKIINPLLNKIIDTLLDTLTIKSPYDTFSVSLENINYYLKNLKSKGDSLENINIIIGVLERDNLHFSKIGKSSGVLINSKGKINQITDQNNLEHFDYISSGKIGYNETILLSNQDLNEHITNSDWEDLTSLESIEKINLNIVDILKDEKVETNIGIIGLKSDLEEKEKGNVNKKLQKAKNVFYKTLDNNLSKKIIAMSMILKEKLETKSKLIKNIIFFTGIVISSIVLFSIISSILGTTNSDTKTTELKNDLIQARQYIRLANQNLTNKELFNLNIKKAEELVAKVEEEKIFLEDIQSIYDDISVIKKQFNGIEIFDGNVGNLTFKGDFSDGIKLLEMDKKLYVIGKSSIYGPIVSGQKIKNNIFNDLDIDDEFLDATLVGDDILLTTKKKRVVKFGKDLEFSYINVIGQTTWEGSPFLSSYNGNLYMTDENQNQIYKHSPSSSSYTSGVPYLTEEDSKSIGKIVSIGIDGGIYILKQDGTLLKFFSSPKYRLESIVLNKLPDNYNIENSSVSFFINNNLTYVYMLINNKIWIFEPNTKIYTDTKSLTYKGQIEGKSDNILGFYAPRDGEIDVLLKGGIYKINFEIKDDKLIIR